MIENKGLISIIVPVYNVERYLERCLDSILAQTYANLEIILIDDGSIDQSGKMCDAYAEKDTRIKVVHQRNQGVSAARNSGLKIAEGEFIGFVDPDDWIEHDMYEFLWYAIQSNNAEMAVCGYEDFGEDGHTLQSTNYESGIFDTEENFCFCLHNDSIWNKLFQREITKHICFDDRFSIGEDCLFLIEICPAIKRSTVVRDVLYHRLIRSDSATQGATIMKHTTSLPVHRQVTEIAKGISRKGFYRAQEKYLDICMQYISDSNASDELKWYVRKHAVSIIHNPFIYWKTKLLYLLHI